MKKLLSILAVAMVFTLVGCSDASAEISKGEEALVSVGDTKITKEEVFEINKKTYGASYTLNEALNIIVKKEKVKLTDEMKEAANAQLETLKTSAGDDFDSMIKKAGYKDETGYKEGEIHPNLLQQGLVKKYVVDKKTSLFKTYTPRKASIIECDDVDKAKQALEAVQGGKRMEEAATEFGVTTTYNGSEAIYTSKSSLPTSVFDNIKSAKKAGISENVIEDTTNQKYYVVNVTNIDSTSFEEEAITAIVSQGSTELSTVSSQYYLKKYEFKIYDKDVYDGLKAVDENYVK